MAEETINIFIVDDEPSLLFSIKNYFSERQISSFENAAGVLSALEKGSACHIILADYKMPDMNGLELLVEVKKKRPDMVCILLTAYADKEMLEQFINKQLLFTIIEKPADMDVIGSVFDDAEKQVEQQYLKKDQINNLKNKVDILEDELNYQIIGLDKGLSEVLKQVEQSASADTTVLISGETGTGKESIARLLHKLGQRKDAPFVAINCSAYSESLIESELFGYEKGAFTGAVGSKAGKFELANGGTIFLDEIGDLSEVIQVKLLRVLQEKQVERLGGKGPLQLDFALVSATNKDLKKEVEEGRFREDLFYRVFVQQIQLPSLRQRKDDIISLAEYYLGYFSVKMGVLKPDLSKEAAAFLLDFPWPGNIRELRNAMEKIMLSFIGRKAGSVIEPADLSFLNNQPSRQFDYHIELDRIADLINQEKKSFETVKSELILAILDKYNGNVLEAADKTGISKNTFYRNIKKHEK